ncbi:MAG: dihydroneopterin aldolase [Bacteroidales bacterium]|nr:dihydroneopterin aldolase [Bacteroidales bacterium]
MYIDRNMTIELTGMEFHSFHGCLEAERTEGNTFMVDFLGKVAAKKAAKSDDLKDTADYSKIYEIVAAEMAEPSNLLENVAGRIVDAIDKAGLGFWFIQVRVSKKNPPVGGVCAWSRVTATSGEKSL